MSWFHDVCGAATQERVGRRAWNRPRVAVSGRLYRQYRVSDPWDPDSAEEDTPVGLGPVSLRLGEKGANRLHTCQTHAKRKEKNAKPAKNRPPRLPDVPKAEPNLVAPAAAKSGSAKAAKQEAEVARAAEVAAKMRAGKRPVVRGPYDSYRAKSPGGKITDRSADSTRPDLEHGTRRWRVVQRIVPRKYPAPATKTAKRGQGGRFRMPRAAASRSPIVRSKTLRDLEQEGAKQAEAPAAPPPRQRTMPSIGGSMDDLFGAAAQMLRQPPAAKGRAR